MGTHQQPQPRLPWAVVQSCGTPQQNNITLVTNHVPEVCRTIPICMPSNSEMPRPSTTASPTLFYAEPQLGRNWEFGHVNRRTDQVLGHAASDLIGQHLGGIAGNCRQRVRTRVSRSGKHAHRCQLSRLLPRSWPLVRRQCLSGRRRYVHLFPRHQRACGNARGRTRSARTASNWTASRGMRRCTTVISSWRWRPGNRCAVKRLSTGASGGAFMNTSSCRCSVPMAKWKPLPAPPAMRPTVNKPSRRWSRPASARMNFLPCWSTNCATAGADQRGCRDARPVRVR